MVFTSFTFMWLFFPLVFLLYRIIPEKHIIWRNGLLLLSSLVFYSWGQRYVLLLIVCILVNYSLGFLIGETQTDRGVATFRNRLFLVLAIILNLLVLGYYKYYNFAITSVNKLFNTNIKVAMITVPIGVSFFTFKSISYLMDIYRRKLPVQHNLLSLGLYISFFPHIMSGPISSYREMAEQIDGQRTLSAHQTAYGVKRFLYGFAKKTLIADQLGTFVDTIYSMNINQVPGSWYWLVMLFYTLQIYYDFSGYSDMAIGLGEMFGFTVEENFNYPYLSCSLREFWRRWHMSLNRWFLNYLYVPLGGSRKGKKRTMLNLMIVFFITGLWHCAGDNFVVWGLWHGAFMLLERIFFGKWLESPNTKLLSRFYTMLVVAFGWVMFRADSMISFIQIFHSMFTFAHVPVSMPLGLYLRPHTIAVFILAMIFCGPAQMMFPSLLRKVNDRERTGLLQTLCLFFIFAVSMLMTIIGTYSSFIYYKF